MLEMSHYLSKLLHNKSIASFVDLKIVVASKKILSYERRKLKNISSLCFTERLKSTYSSYLKMEIRKGVKKKRCVMAGTTVL